jgi:hypothetical protein
MKRKVASTALMTIFGLGLSIAAQAEDGDRACSLAGAAGNWSFTDNGTVIGIGPRSAVGVFTLDDWCTVPR